MGAARKLQQEIDQVMKKVKEGLASFDEIHEKIEDQTQGHQREKLVASLKDQIKKLQKDRDKIKTWLGDKDVRDKNGLTEARATIERRMEKFKECEKDMKVKSFSKLGLDRAAKQDPHQLAVEERSEWLKQTVDRLNNMVEVNEAEIEVAMSTVKRNKEPPPRARQLQELNVRHKRHTERLEQVQRALMNDAVSPEQVDELKDSVDIYIDEAHDDTDGAYDDVDALYAEDLLDVLDSVDVHVPVLPEKVPAKEPADKNDKKAQRAEREAEKARADAERAREREKANIAAMRAQIANKGNNNFPSTAALEDKQPARGAARDAAHASAAAAAAAAAAASASASGTAAAQPQQPPPPPPPRGAAAAGSLAASPSPASQAAGAGPSVAPSHVSDSSASSTPVPKALMPPPGKAWAGAAPPPPPPPPGDRSPEAAQPRSPSRTSPASSLGTAHASLSGPPGLGKGVSTRLPSLGVDAAPTSPELHAVPIVAPAPHEATHPAMLLDGKQPTDADSQWNHYTCARRVPIPAQVDARLPDSFPRAPPANLDSADLYKSLASGQEEQLFAIFYLSPGTLYQYQAAMELKRRNWQFHKGHRQWFRRHEHDGAAFVRTDAYEEGNYIYFDYQLDRADAWVFRLKQDYRMPYNQLERELTPEA